MLKIEKLTKRFDGKLILDDLNFEVGRGEFVSIVGHSGCGKSTLLNCLAGLEEFDGSITIDGVPNDRERAFCGVVFQDYALFPWLTVEQNVRFGLRFMTPRLGQEAEREQVKRLLGMMRLTDARRLYPHQLSGGMRQRVAIARSLIIDPPILLMDEPFASLDALNRHRLGLEVVKIWQTTGKIVLFVTHSASEAVMLSDRVMVLHGGQVAHVAEIAAERPRTLSQESVGQQIDRLNSVLTQLQQDGARQT